MQRNAVKLTEAEKAAFSLAREALSISESELTNRIIEQQKCRDTATSEEDKSYHNGEVAKSLVKLADSVIARELLWQLQYRM